MEEHTQEARDEVNAARPQVRTSTASRSLIPQLDISKIRIAVYASLMANFSLCVLQCTVNHTLFVSMLIWTLLDTVYAAISSLSFSLLATGIDSIFDIGSNVMLFWLHRKATRLDVNKWPVGGMRLETIGNIVYGECLCPWRSRTYFF